MCYQRERSTRPAVRSVIAQMRLRAVGEYQRRMCDVSHRRETPSHHAVSESTRFERHAKCHYHLAVRFMKGGVLELSLVIRRHLFDGSYRRGVELVQFHRLDFAGAAYHGDCVCHASLLRSKANRDPTVDVLPATLHHLYVEMRLVGAVMHLQTGERLDGARVGRGQGAVGRSPSTAG